MKNIVNRSNSKISISICTRERPQMLSRLLESLADMLYPDDLFVSIDIFENGDTKTLTEIIQKVSKRIPIDVNHHWEQRLGIPIVRNTALKAAKDADVTHIIFIDDDERVDQLWLQNLWNYYMQCDEDTVIQGAVISSIETKKNPHLHCQFQRPVKSTGETLDWCATNNVLINLKVLFDHQLWFDETRPLAGGTDSKLFHQAHACGIPMRYCAEAIVYEDIPEERVGIAWLGKRHFRIGLTVGQNKKKEGERLSYPLNHGWLAFRNSIKSISALIRFNRQKFHKRWLRASKCMGKALGFFNVTIDSYKKIDGE
jgi:succinoglycan biosynthesis protein ExoM